MISHTIYHLNRDVRLWRMNMRLSRHIRKQITRKDGDLTFTFGTAAKLKEIESLHAQCFRQLMVPWLKWVYKFRMNELCGMVLDKEGKVVAYDLFMFQEAEQDQGIIHEIYVAVAPEYQGQGLSTKLRQFSLECYDDGCLKGASTLAGFDHVKALRSAQKSGYAITKSSAKPPAHYLYRPFHKVR